MTIDPDTGRDSDAGPPRAVIIAAIAVAVVAVGIVLVIAATRAAPSQVTVSAVAAPQAGSPACQALSAALPQRLGDYRRVPIAAPAPPGATAWRTDGRGEPVVLRCGLDRPGAFVVGSPIQVVDKVQWFETERESAGDAGRSVWYTVDRPVYVALTLPSGSGPTPIQQVSEVIDHTMAAVPIDPAPAR
ncbi:DUF3515 domain-containing protein [Mycobacterium sp. Marseille-P9652]|uniref:DUF3515 domain-containing protein n=1 Tax=Mycobacterium sp. Marseille-P9652 TaxID=2654950 RepID=UPI0012E88DD2|nr:DUF3515 domain-containing protein [Mycobacterium sp. Marseille-P9652]